MKTLTIFIAFISLLACSCSKSNEKAYAAEIKETMIKDDSASFIVSYREEYPVDSNPVYLQFQISSFQRYLDLLSLESNINVKNEVLTIDIINIKNKGICPDLSSYSSKHNWQEDKLCAAYGTSMVGNLKRGEYKFSMLFLDEEIAKGSLILTDQSAKLKIGKGSKIRLTNNEINVIPDSCIFGHFYPTGKFSKVSFNNFLEAIKQFGCKDVKLNSGYYRRFQVDNEGNIMQEGYFVLKTRNNFDEINAFLSNHIKYNPDVYGFIFEDSYGRYYNIKRP